jgi:hypothetical protein
LRQFYYCNYISNELTASVNAFPNKWLNAALSYSVFNGSNTFGGGLGVRTGFVHWFAALDYMPLKKTTLSSLKLDGLNLKNIPLPYNLKNCNLSIGANIVFDEHVKDKNKRVESKESRPMNARTGLFHSKFKDDNDCNCN